MPSVRFSLSGGRLAPDRQPQSEAADAVVDSKLRVHGLRGLRVAAASVMPSIISGPGTNAASYMIGGRAAELINADV